MACCPTRCHCILDTRECNCHLIIPHISRVLWVMPDYYHLRWEDLEVQFHSSVVPRNLLLAV